MSHFPEDRPMREFCGSTDDHPPHKASREQSTWQGTETWWYECPGWKTTHVVEVREAGGRVVGQEALDLRGALDYNGSTNDPVLTMLFEASEAGKPRPSDDELTFGAAAYAAAPEVCPWDSDRCHEHLYDFAESLEEDEED